MKTVIIATETKAGGYQASHRDHVLAFGRDRYGLVFIPAGEEGRQVTQGPMVPGPWAQAFALSSVIAANRDMSTGAVAARNRAAGTEHAVEVGDEVILGGVRFRVAQGRGFRPDYLRLDVVACDRCGSPRVAGQSCDCFDNGCQ